jgi:CspA family cold shock protein
MVARARRICVVKREAEMATGTVKFFNHNRGFGFIEPADGSPDVFVHATAVEKAGMPALAEGQKLNYEVEIDERSGKSAATNLQNA